MASLAAVALSVTLAGCGAAPAAAPSVTASPTPTVSATPTPTPTPATPAKVVTSLAEFNVTGAAGAAPVVTMAPPLAIDATKSSVLIPGQGSVVPQGAIVEVQYAGYNARTGAKFDSSWDRGGSPVAFPLENVVTGFRTGLEGKKVGDRVLIAMTGADGYDASGGNPSIDIAVGDTLVFVVDIVETSVDGPTGAEVAPAAGVPSVTLVDGKPTISSTAGLTAPTSLVVQPLTQGSGRAVAAGDHVAVRYRSWSWQTGKQLEDRFTGVDTGKLSDTITAWQKGVAGQRIGTRLVIVAPPAESFPEGNTNPPITKGDSVVYVIDILFASPKQFA